MLESLIYKEGTGVFFKKYLPLSNIRQMHIFRGVEIQFALSLIENQEDSSLFAS